MQIQAVIFDWAGTIIDFGSFAPVIAFTELFREYGIDVEAGEIRQYMGHLKRDQLQKILELPRVADLWVERHGARWGENDVDSMYERFNTVLDDVLEKTSEPVAGVVGLFAWLRGTGIKIGSTTGYVRNTMNKVVPSAGRWGLSVDSLVTSDEVPEGRPAPYMCYMNAIRLGVYPMYRMVKVGDARSDILEGINAGMWSVGVVSGGSELGLSRDELAALPPEELDDRFQAVRRTLTSLGAHYAIDSVGDLPKAIEDIERRLSAGERPDDDR